jgi:hypothetical protein
LHHSFYLRSAEFLFLNSLFAAPRTAVTRQIWRLKGLGPFLPCTRLSSLSRLGFSDSRGSRDHCSTMPLDWELRERRAEEARLGLLPPYSSESPLFFFLSVLRRGRPPSRDCLISCLPDCQPSSSSGGEGALGCPAMGRWMGRSRSPVPSPASRRRKLYLIGRLVPYQGQGPMARGEPTLIDNAHAHFDFTSSIFLHSFHLDLSSMLTGGM